MSFEQYLKATDKEIVELEGKGDVQLQIYRGLTLAIRQLGKENPRAKQLIDNVIPRRTEGTDIAEPQEEPPFLEEWKKMKQLYQDIEGLKLYEQYQDLSDEGLQALEEETKRIIRRAIWQNVQQMLIEKPEFGDDFKIEFLLNGTRETFIEEWNRLKAFINRMNQ